MFLRWMSVLSFTAVVAGCLAVFWQPPSVDWQLAEIELTPLVGAEAAARLAAEPDPVRAVLFDWATDPELLLKARIALIKYPERAPRVLQVYGSDPVFQSIVRDYGEAVIPIVDHWMGDSPAVDDLSAAQDGWVAVSAIHDRGYDFLGQFFQGEDGIVYRNRTEQVLEFLALLTADGIRGLERKFKLGEEIGPRDWLPATMDAAIVVPAGLAIGGAKMAVRGARLRRVSAASSGGVAPASAARLYQLASRGPLAASLARTGKIGAVIGVGYVLVRHPSLLPALFDELATWLALPRLPVAMAIWMILLGGIMLCFGLLRRTWFRWHDFRSDHGQLRHD
ncbi:MAG: hypothetical protein SVU69_10660 [Pseudomonadota bacterium]|nr:hypothetical protein [Pseudomonadota bacterium]